MKSYVELSEEYGCTVDDVRTCANLAYKYDYKGFHGVDRGPWFIPSISGEWVASEYERCSSEFCSCEGKTRQEVIEKHLSAFKKSNFDDYGQFRYYGN